MSRRRIVLSGIAVLALAAARLPTRRTRRHLRIRTTSWCCPSTACTQSDLVAYVRSHPHSALAQLVAGGTSYTAAQTTFPSDSFPGMVAQFTGAGPGTSGVFYDDTYNPTLFAAGHAELPDRRAGH